MIFPMLAISRYAVQCTDHTHSVMQPSLLRNLPKLSPSTLSTNCWSPGQLQGPAVPL